MNPENEGKKKGPLERKGAHLNEAFRAHGGSLSCGCYPNPEGKLQPGSTFYPELVELLKKSTDRTSRDYLNRQRTARDRLRDLLAQTPELWATSTPEIEQLQEYFDCFDDFWFLGLLRARCKVRWIIPSDCIGLEVSGQAKAVSTCWEHRQIHKIDILLRCEPRGCPDNQRCHRILSTLLHELCHAVLNIYGCKCHISMADFLYFRGLEGHGKAWADLFLWVRVSARIVFELQIDLDWHYNYSLRHEAASLERLIKDGSADDSDRSYQHQGFGFQSGTVMTVPANAELENLWREWKLRVAWTSPCSIAGISPIVNIYMT